MTLWEQSRQNDLVLAPTPQARWKLVAAAWAFVLGCAIIIAEIGVRVMMSTNPHTGLAMLGPIPLLPYRPTEEAVRRAYANTLDATYVVRDPDLGWTIKPGGSAGDYSANPQGIRALPSRTFTSSVPPGKTRMITVGDSFTHGDGVRLEETWQAQLESIRPDLEVLNLGGPGYGTDQAVLRWEKEGRVFRSNFVVLGIWPENIARNLNILRFLMSPVSGLEMSKPRFLPREGEPSLALEGEPDEPSGLGHDLVLINVPTLDEQGLIRALVDGAPKQLLTHELWWRESEQTFPWYFHLATLRTFRSGIALFERKHLRERLYRGEDPSGIELTTALARRFAKTVKTHGAEPIVVVFPMRELLDRMAIPHVFPLTQALEAAELRVVELGPRFAEAEEKGTTSSLFLADGHLTAAGNQLVAETLAASVP